MTRATPLELFRRACGLAAPMALSYRDEATPDGGPTVLESLEPFLLIGRSPKNRIAMNDGRVSRRHAFLQAVAGGVACIDLKSRTQTFRDDEATARPWAWLEPGHSIRVGPLRIERTDHRSDGIVGPDALDPFAPTDHPDDPPRPSFELPFRVGGVASTWDVPCLLALVGREDHCQFVLQDDSISRTHACLVRTPVGTWVVDLEARDGVHVNGTRVRWAWLADGDIVRFGLFTMVVRYDRIPEGLDRDAVPLEAGSSSAIDVGPTAGPGTGLALRPNARPPAPRKAAGPPAGRRAAQPPAFDQGEWEPVPGMGPHPYALWQQQIQLMESFHHDMTMMVQMFLAMHREFQSSVREELARVQKLTKELSRLNARLLQTPEASEKGPAPAPGGPEAPAEPTASQGPTASGKVPPTRSARRVDQPAGSGFGHRAGAPDTTARPAPAPDGSGPALRTESTEMYADITRRITDLQRQRRGYWKRILQAING